MKIFKKLLLVFVIASLLGGAIVNQQKVDAKKAKSIKSAVSKYDTYARFAKGEDGIAIFCYHRISNGNHLTTVTQDMSTSMQLKSFNVNVDDFEYQMKYLHDHNIKVISVDEAIKIAKKGKVKGQYVVITFDDIDATIENAIPILHKYKYPYTTFVIGSKVDQYIEGTFTANWETVEKISKDPLNTMGYHSYNAHYQVNDKPYLLQITDKNFSKDFASAKKIMAKHGIKHIKYYAPPYGEIKKKSSKFLVDKKHIECVFTLDNDLFKSYDQKYKVPRIIVTKKSFENVKEWLDE